MAIALVGSVGAVSTSASGAAVTPAWGAGANRTAGNLLILLVACTGSATQAATPAGWSQGTRPTGTSCSSGCFYKIAAGADAAPTVAAITSTVINAQLYEFSGVLATGFLTGFSSGLTSPNVCTASAADTTHPALMVTFAAHACTSRALATQTDTFNNGTAIQTSNKATTTASHYDFCYALTTSHATANSDSLAFTTTQITGMCNGIMSFQPVVPILANAQTATGTGVANDATVTVVTPPVWSFVQSPPPSSTAKAATVSVTFASPLSSGSKLIAVCTANRSFDGDFTGAGVSGVSAGGYAFTQLFEAIGSDAPHTKDLAESVWILDTPAGLVGTTPTITATCTNNTATSGGQAIVCQEVTGLLAGTVFHYNYNTVYGTTAPSCVCATDTNGDYLLNIITDTGSSNVLVVPSGFVGYGGTTPNTTGQIRLAWRKTDSNPDGGEQWTGISGTYLRMAGAVSLAQGVPPPITALATTGTATGTAYNPTVTVKPTPTAATAAGTITPNVIVTVASASAQTIAKTGTAYNPTVTSGGPATFSAQAAAALGVANDTTLTRTGTPAASAVTGSGTSYAATITTAGTSQATVAPGTGVAYNATITASQSVPAVAATATGVSHAPAISTTRSASPTTAAGTGVVNSTALAISGSASPQTALGTGVAQSAVTGTASTANTPATTAVATGTAYAPAISTTRSAPSAVALGTGVANDASISTTRSAAALTATGTGTANNGTTTTASVANINALTATGTGSVLAPADSVRVTSGVATSAGAAQPTTVTTAATAAANAQVATAAGLVLPPTQTVKPTLSVVAVTGLAQAPTLVGASTAAVNALTAVGTGLVLPATRLIRPSLVTVSAAGAAQGSTIRVETFGRLTGQWNGVEVVALMWGPDEVVDFVLTPV